MASLFEQRCDKINDALDAIRARCGQVPVTKALGREALFEQMGRPRVVWVRAPGSTAVPSERRSLVKRSTGERFRVRATIRAGVWAFCCGEDDEQTEQLHAHLIEAVLDACNAQMVDIGAHDWPTQEEGGSGKVFGGRSYVRQLFYWKVPITTSEGAPTVITAQSHTDTFDETSVSHP